MTKKLTVEQRAKANARSRKWLQRHRAQQTKAQLAWARRNREKVRVIQRRWYAKRGAAQYRQRQLQKRRVEYEVVIAASISNLQLPESKRALRQDIQDAMVLVAIRYLTPQRGPRIHLGAKPKPFHPRSFWQWGIKARTKTRLAATFVYSVQLKNPKLLKARKGS